MQAALATYGLTREYATGGGVRGITFQVQPGEALGLIGPPSSGKSTLLKLLATRLPATSGSFVILGHRIPSYQAPSQSITAARHNTGVLLEDVPVAGGLNGWENAWMIGRLHGLSESEISRRLRNLFDWAGLAPLAYQPARTYSYPMRRKLGLIQALLHEPRMLLLDEPCLCLEVPARATLQERLLHLRRQGATVVMATCNAAEAEQLCTRLILLDSGRILADGPASNLLNSLGAWSAVEVRLGGVLGPLDLSEVPGVCAPPEYMGGGLRLHVTDSDKALAPFMACIARAGGRVRSVNIKRTGPGREP